MSGTGKVNFFKGATTTRLTSKKLTGAPSSRPLEVDEANANTAGTDAADGGALSHDENEKSESASLFDEMRKMSATLLSVATDVATIKEITKELKDSLETVQTRVGEAERRISDLEDDNELAKTKMDTVEKKVEHLWSRVEDLENRSRRNNVRIVGLKEGLEEPGKMSQYVEKILTGALGLTGGEFEIERAHRAPVPIPDPTKQPRAVLVRFLRSSAREHVLRIARVKRGFDWEGRRISIFEDVTKELAEKRKAFGPVKKRLRELQVNKRQECGILTENLYVFPRPSSLTCYCSSDSLRYFAKACAAKSPDSLTSTKLRKQTATLSQVLNLSNDELDQLADFLGHDIRVHRQSYRLPKGTLQQAKISKVLLALEQGRVAAYKGMSLDEININPEVTKMKILWTRIKLSKTWNQPISETHQGSPPAAGEMDVRTVRPSEQNRQTVWSRADRCAQGWAVCVGDERRSKEEDTRRWRVVSSA
ncbi:hypothetical protein WMY93_015691 [Mugilogobius chulae]|uniref:L1 transposable element RRM domain-containing protein n=1 Tax=Mugilogobius chulae TaxID=88201 RepID=A0AAW0P0Y9_9GOBI